ncbi:Flagellar basal body rod protein FlgB [Andreprevotia sp. IGB-42]|uniref:flagellar basal body rod protein FlgB n=1 Tax=Andreprevotia sp. IGB-42 TaxID=2497473 RepID=UPI00135874FA|nr:flagellar basal body rod protein FlgB [Andreprevotia sp. IGB-42]KAF0812511.1 Flagellar basal body rod protein FlgB [Andreprevotia sp. IGB-42]
MIGQLNSYFSSQEAALKLRSARQEVLSANIANADTPSYKARDFDFAVAFKAATGRQQAPAIAATDPRHLQPKSSMVDPFAPELLYRNPNQSSIDGNTVEMDSEMQAFSDNTIRYQAALTFMTRRIESMKTALTGQ